MGGLPLVMITGSGMGPGGDSVSFTGRLRETAERLGQNGVALYIVDARGIQAPVPDRPRGALSGTQPFAAVNEDVRLSMTMMANITGGRFINYSNDASDGVREAARDMAGSYTLGFYAATEPDGHWHDVALQTTRPGVRLQYRTGYVAEKPPAVPRALRDSDWRSMITSREPARGITMKAFAERDEKSGNLLVQTQIDVPGIAFRASGDAVEADLEVCVAEIGADGRVQFDTEAATLRLQPQEWQLVRIGGVPWARAWRPRTGTARVKLLVRDRATGDYGAVEIPVAD